MTRSQDWMGLGEALDCSNVSHPSLLKALPAMICFLPHQHTLNTVFVPCFLWAHLIHRPLISWKPSQERTCRLIRQKGTLEDTWAHPLGAADALTHERSCHVTLLAGGLTQVSLLLGPYLINPIPWWLPLLLFKGGKFQKKGIWFGERANAHLGSSPEY